MTILMWHVHKRIRGAQMIDKVYDFGFSIAFDASVFVVLVTVYDFLKG